MVADYQVVKWCDPGLHGAASSTKWTAMRIPVYLIARVAWLLAAVAAYRGDAASPTPSRMLPWRGDADFGADAPRLRRVLAEVCVAELRDVAIESDFKAAAHSLGELYLGATGKNVSFLIRAGGERAHSFSSFPRVRLNRRSTTLSRAMDEICGQAQFYWELTPIGIVCFDAWNLEQWKKRARRGDPRGAANDMAAAQKAGDESAIWRHAEAWASALGDAKAVPPEPDALIEIPTDAQMLTPAEVQSGFEIYYRELQKNRWWRIGLDPTKTPQLPRDVGLAILGCTAADRAGLPAKEEMIQFAREAGDYIMWTQKTADKDVVPLPFCRSGLPAAAIISRIGVSAAANSKGWLTDDMGDGCMQVDNGICGVALYEMYEATKEPKFFDKACDAADWAKRAPIAQNAVYNSRSVHLLTWGYDSMGNRPYFEAALKRLKLGVLPGQIMQGPLMGRWADPECASATGHFTIVRVLAHLLEVLPEADPDRGMVIGALRAGLAAWRTHFAEGRLPDTDAALEALVAVERLRLMRPELMDFGALGIGEALAAYEKAGAAALRSGRLRFGANAWGALLELRAKGASIHRRRPRAQVR